MWNSHFLFLRVRIKLRKFSIRAYIALYPVSHFLLSLESVLSLIPFSFGSWARKALNTLHRCLLTFMRSIDDDFIDVELEDKSERIYVSINPARPRLYYLKGRSLCISCPLAGFFAQLGACEAGLMLGAVLFGFEYSQALLCGAILSLIYTFVRPLTKLVALGPDMLLFGLAGVLLDALLIMWAAAWSNGMTLGYLSSIAVALIIDSFFSLYAYYIYARLYRG